MKLHKDGTVEGTPQEIAEYNRLQMEQSKNQPLKYQPFGGFNPLLPPPGGMPKITCGETSGQMTVRPTQIKVMSGSLDDLIDQMFKQTSDIKRNTH